MSTGTTGYLFGVFDLFHVAHLAAVRGAALGSERLVVGVASDELVREICGVAPFVPQIERLEIVRAVRAIHEVRLLDSLDVAREVKQMAADVLYLPDADLDAVQSAVALGGLDSLGVPVVRLEDIQPTTSVVVRNALSRTSSRGVA